MHATINKKWESFCFVGVQKRHTHKENIETPKLSRGFILYRRGLRYMGKSSCFFPAIKSTIGATVGCIAYRSFWWDVQDDIMRKG